MIMDHAPLIIRFARLSVTILALLLVLYAHFLLTKAGKKNPIVIEEVLSIIRDSKAFVIIAICMLVFSYWRIFDSICCLLLMGMDISVSFLNYQWEGWLREAIKQFF